MSMDEQSFDLLMNKLESLEAGQARIESQMHSRLDKHFALFQQHAEEDKKLGEQLMSLDREVTFAKGVAYVLSGGTAMGAWVSGWFK